MTILKTTLRDYLEQAGAVFERPVTEALINGWTACTESVTTEQFEETFWAACEHGFPTPVKLLQTVQGISPKTDWDLIMGVATGRFTQGEISGYAAAALREVGGVKALAAADDRTTKELRKKWDEVMATAGGTNALPAASEIIQLGSTTGAAEMGDYAPDTTGEHRARALLKLLKEGRIKPELAAKLAAAGTVLGQTRVGALPAAQRDRVLATVAVERM